MKQKTVEQIRVEQLGFFQTGESVESGKYIQSNGREFCRWYHTKKKKKILVFKNIMENGKMKKENKLTNTQFLEMEIKS